MDTTIEIITCTLGGRTEYLKTCIGSVARAAHFSQYIKHNIVLQGISWSNLDPAIKQVIKFYQQKSFYNINIIEFKENVGIANALNHVSEMVSNDSLIFKMDDDCQIISDRFFECARAIHKQFPSAVFSPYPVGLIRSPGGPPGRNHILYKNNDLDQIFTLRIVDHVGGFARFAPSNLFWRPSNPSGFRFQGDLIKGASGNEDGQLSGHCARSGIQMFYLENGMIVEHMESTYGQVARYPEYFKDRSWESSLISRLNVIES